MATIQVRSKTGDVVGEATLAPELFEAQVNVPVMHQVVVAQMAARRSGTHDTKTRAEVRGGGKKPYRQKGTGRARQGSIRAPHYTGGGIVWGPHPRDHSVKVPKKMRVLALRSALSDRAREGKVLVLDEVSFEQPRTKDAIGILDAAGAAKGSVLLVLDTVDDSVLRSFRNLQRVHCIAVDQINTYDIISRDWLVLTKNALEALNARAEQVARKGSRAKATPEADTPAPATDAKAAQATDDGEEAGA